MLEKNEYRKSLVYLLLPHEEPENMRKRTLNKNTFLNKNFLILSREPTSE